ncbi:MAG TPA: DUF3800 domain-containing protein [Solirubrobacterales bacterium]
MASRYVFADEAGNFDFSKKAGASRYFILTTVTMEDCRAGDALALLRRELTWSGVNLPRPFHATDDTHQVRSAVFDLLKRSPIRIDATVLEKRKAEPHLQDELKLYKMGWFLHFKYVAPQIATSQDRLLVVAASLGTKKTRRFFNEAVDDVVRQVSPARHRVAFWAADSDPCIQVADYCCWAVQRAWERQDRRYLDILGSKVRTNKDIWATGSTLYY